MSITELVNENTVKHMFEAEKETWTLISEQNTHLQGHLMKYLINVQEHLTKKHGSGKDYLGTAMYEQFMEDKWSIACCEIQDVLNLYKQDLISMD